MQMNGAEAVTTELSRDLGGETRRNGKAPANGETSVQSPKSLRIDPEFRSLIPPLTDDEFTQLEANIIAEGCREPLIVWNGVVVDGHNRYDICVRHGIPFEVREKHFADRTAAMLWMIDNQKGRRNLADIDKIALARKREELLKPIAQANRFEAGKATGRGNKKVSAILPRPLSTRREAAKEAGVGERTYDAGKLILEAVEKGEVEQEVLDRLRKRETSIHREAKRVKEQRARKQRQAKRLEAVQDAPVIDRRILVGDFRSVADQIPDGSVSLIFTDPPYDRKASEMLPDLTAFAEAKLAEGGSLLCYVGQTQLPVAMDALRTKLRYWWTVACVHSGQKTVMREYGVNAGWKPVLWFVKGTRDDNTVMVNDVMSGGQEKSYHDWQQAQSEAEYWIEKLCPPDGIVCDPFLGGGTTAAAAEKLGRKWIGIEIDPEQAKIASARLASLGGGGRE